MSTTFVAAVITTLAVATHVGDRAVAAPTQIDDDDGAPVFSLTVAHVNDLHSHFEEVNAMTGRCQASESETGQCYGGFARLYTLTRRLRAAAEKRGDDFLLLNAGDFFQGTIWYTIFKYQPVVEFGNLMNYTAMGLGNHDFDDSLAGLLPYADQANYDLLAANVRDRIELVDADHPPLEPHIARSKVVNATGGWRIGIVGYVTASTHVISKPGPSVEFDDVVAAVRNEARRLIEEEGVQIIIALGHNGYENDRVMARQISELDVVIGGHSHTFLWPPNKPLPKQDVDVPAGPYPTYVEQPSGKVVPVVQAYCYTKYMGQLQLRFGGNGNLLTPVNGSGVEVADVITVDASIEKDAWIESKMDRYRAQLTPYYNVVGSTEIDLVTGGQREFAFGNAITDGMFTSFPAGSVDAAVLNNGGIRSIISAGDITGEDIYNALPFNNTLVVVAISGRDIKHNLNRFASSLCPPANCYASTFLQMSGVRVEYDVRYDNKYNRLTSIKTKRCSERHSERAPSTADSDEQWCDIEDDVTYRVVMPSFLANGGSAVFRFEEHPQLTATAEFAPETANISDFASFRNYVATNSPLNPHVEGRIVIRYHDNTPPSAALPLTSNFAMNKQLAILSVVSLVVATSCYAAIFDAY